MRRLLFSALFAVGCRAPETPVPTEETPAKLEDGRFRLPQDDLLGASGLTRAPDGSYWSVLERGRRAYRFRLTNGLDLAPPVPIVGVEDGIDLEALAWVDEETVAFGTESRDMSRPGDPILFARVEPTRWRLLDRRILVSYAPFGLKPERNRGLEGLCYANGRLVTAGELVGEQNGRRFAPVIHVSADGSHPSRFRVFLTTKTGKISALACRTSTSRRAIEVDAIERHFGVLRLLRFELPIEPTDEIQDREPTIVRDLADRLGDDRPNFEGLALDPQGGGWVFMSDNDYRGVTGPTQIMIVDPPLTHPRSEGPR